MDKTDATPTFLSSPSNRPAKIGREFERRKIFAHLLPAFGGLRGGTAPKIKPAKIIPFLKEKNCCPPLI